MADLGAEGLARKRVAADETQLFTIGYDDQGVEEALKKMRVRAQSLAPVYRLWGEYMLLSIDDNYVRETDPFGVPWRKNSPYTIALKASLGRINKILQSTGLMRSSYNYRISGAGVEVGTNDPKAYKHQFGIDVPQRIHLGVSLDDLAEMKLALIGYVADNDTSQRAPIK